MARNNPLLDASSRSLFEIRICLFFTMRNKVMQPIAIKLREATITRVGQSINLERTAVNPSIKIPRLQIKKGLILFIELIITGSYTSRQTNGLMRLFFWRFFNANAMV